MTRPEPRPTPHERHVDAGERTGKDPCPYCDDTGRLADDGGRRCPICRAVAA